MARLNDMDMQEQPGHRRNLGGGSSNVTWVIVLLVAGVAAGFWYLSSRYQGEGDAAKSIEAAKADAPKVAEPGKAEAPKTAEVGKADAPKTADATPTAAAPATAPVVTPLPTTTPTPAPAAAKPAKSKHSSRASSHRAPTAAAGGLPRLSTPPPADDGT